jgi:hypothetical protein
MTVVPREAFAQSKSAGNSAYKITQEDASRAPLMGMTAKVVPQRESVMAQPSAARAPAPQPPAALQARPVYSRIAPQPAPLPFAQKREDLAANPGRPIDPAALAKMRQAQKAPAPPVTLVKPVPALRPEAPAPAQASPASSKASALIATLKGRSLPEADRSLSEARKVPGIRLDLNALAGRIAAERQALGAADSDMAAKRYEQALQEATSVQDQIADIMNQLSTATSSSKRRR